MCRTCGFFWTMHGSFSNPSVVPSSTGLPSKWCPGIGFLSRLDRTIGVFRHVAPPTRLRLEFPPEKGLILRCAGMGGNSFQAKQGNLPSCRDQEGRKSSDEVVPGTSVFPSVRTVCRGTFGVTSRVKSSISHFKTERGTSLETL